MKHLRNFTLIFVIFISSSFTAFAQSKVAHINTQELIQSMPKTVSAQSELNKLIKSYQTDIEAMRIHSGRLRMMLLTFLTKLPAVANLVAITRIALSRWNSIIHAIYPAVIVEIPS